MLREVEVLDEREMRQGDRIQIVRTVRIREIYTPEEIAVHVKRMASLASSALEARKALQPTIHVEIEEGI